VTRDSRDGTRGGPQARRFSAGAFNRILAGVVFLLRARVATCNLAERFLSKLKQFRRSAIRFEKLAPNFVAAVLFASASI